MSRRVSDTTSYIPPWTEPYIIGVAGNSGSGKTSVSQQIISEINQPWTVLLSFDNFYNPLTPEERKLAFDNNFDFDTPESMDLDLLVETVKKLKRGERTNIPIYSFVHHNRTDKSTSIYGANVIIIEGIYALYDSRLRDLMDLKIYVDTDLDICLARRLTRDILYRGRNLEGAMKQWQRFVKPNAVRYVQPTMNNADLVIPRGLDNTVAIDLMIQHVQKQLHLKSINHINHLKALGKNITLKVDECPNIQFLPSNNQSKGINSILFNESTSMGDFIFYFDRISSLLIEAACNAFIQDFDPVQLSTATTQFTGLRQTQTLAAVSIIRSGDCFMTSIKRTFRDIPIGKLLIQSDSATGEPKLHYESLPKELFSKAEKKKILTFDSQIISGAAAIMAIQILIDHNIKQEDIVIVTYLCTELGLRRLMHAFPRVNIMIGKLSCMEISGTAKRYNEENFKDSYWHFRNRFIDNIYFGTN